MKLVSNLIWTSIGITIVPIWEREEARTNERKKCVVFVWRLQTRQMPQGGARYPHNTITARRAGIMQASRHYRDYVSSWSTWVDKAAIGHTSFWISSCGRDGRPASVHARARCTQTHRRAKWAQESQVPKRGAHGFSGSCHESALTRNSLYALSSMNRTLVPCLFHNIIDHHVEKMGSYQSEWSESFIGRVALAITKYFGLCLKIVQNF